jgi:Predicted dinucleotide-binding enzymes
VSPLIGGRAVKGPAAGMLLRLQGGTTAAHVAQCYPGLIDALVLDEEDAADADAVSQLGVRPVVARTVDARSGCAQTARRGGARRGGIRVRVAIVGGTGTFGRALAKRLQELGKDEVLVGSRDAERAQATAEVLGVTGGQNADIVAGADLVVPRGQVRCDTRDRERAGRRDRQDAAALRRERPALHA